MSNTRKIPQSKAKATPAPPTLDDLLGEDTRPEKVVPLCLRGHLQAQWDHLKEQYDAGPGEDDKAMIVDRAAKRRVADQMAQVEAEMRAGTVHFRLRALPRRRTSEMPKSQVVWHELVEAHPPRKDGNGKVDAQDVRAGLNMATLPDALIRVSIVEPEMSDAQWEQLSHAKLTDAQWERLFTAAWQLNRTEVDVPFSPAAWRTRTSDAESRRRNDSASPSSASTVGSRSRSRSTNTTTVES